MKRVYLITLFSAAALVCGPAPAQEPKKPDSIFGTLLPDRVVAKGKGVEVMASQVDEAYVAFKSNRAANGRPVSDAQRKAIEAQIIDKLIATQLFLQRATEADKQEGAATAEKFVNEVKKRATSEAAFNRELIAQGFTPAQFEQQVKEQAIVKAVIDRELKAKQVIPPEDVRKFYDENAERFKEPERFKVSHILLTTKDQAGRDLPTDVRAEKRQKLEGILQQVRDGKKWETLVADNTEDAATKENKGEYTFARGEMPLEFEAAAISLQPGQISDIVTTRYGMHLIRLIERIPSRTVEFAAVQDRIRESLLQEAVQKQLPLHVESLKKEAGVEITGM